jgi:hypothetical protein
MTLTPSELGRLCEILSVGKGPKFSFERDSCVRQRSKDSSERFLNSGVI